MDNYTNNLNNLNETLKDVAKTTTLNSEQNVINNTRSDANSVKTNTMVDKIFTRPCVYYICIPIVIFILLYTTKPIFVTKLKFNYQNSNNYFQKNMGYINNERCLCFKSLIKWTIILSIILYGILYYLSMNKPIECSTLCK